MKQVTLWKKCTASVSNKTLNLQQFHNMNVEYEVDNEIEFYGVIKSVKHLVTMLKAINIKSVNTFRSYFIRKVASARLVRPPSNKYCHI